METTFKMTITEAVEKIYNIIMEQEVFSKHLRTDITAVEVGSASTQIYVDTKNNYFRKAIGRVVKANPDIFFLGSFNKELRYVDLMHTQDFRKYLISQAMAQQLT